MDFKHIGRMNFLRSKRKAFLLMAMLLTGGMASAQVVVKGNVYGGGEYGKVTQNTSVTINNDTVNGSVYGGGKGSLDDEESGLVKGNATVIMTGGTVERSIYGGGQLGSVGTFTEKYPEGTTGLHVPGEPKKCLENTGLAKVVVSGGSVGKKGSLMPLIGHNPDDDDRGWIFCGGRGEVDSINNPKANLLAVVDTTYLEISGNALVTASVYGGSENGLVLSGTYVKIMGGQIGTGYKGNNLWDEVYTEQQWDTTILAIKQGRFTPAHAAPFHECNSWPFGDGNGNYYVYDIFANNPDAPAGGALQGSDGHSFFGNVFGGGSGYYPIKAGVWRRSAGRVIGNTRVDISGGHILTSVYGGNEITDVFGKCTINMSGGTLGVPRDSLSIANHPVTCYLFGAGMGDDRTFFDTWTNVEETEVNVTGGTIFGSIFGGGEDGHVLSDIKVTVEGNDTHIGTLGYSYVDGNVFGGGRGFSGTALTAGSVGGNITVDIKGGTMLGSIYGGGRLASVGTYFTAPTSPNYGLLQPGTDHGYITINITGGTIGNDYEDIQHPTEHTKGGNVFGGCMGRVEKLDGTENTLWPRLACAKQTKVNVTGNNNVIIKGNIYGGPEIGHVHDSAIVIFDNENARVHRIFGGGHGSENLTMHQNDSTSALGPHAVPANLAGRVMGNTLVKIKKGWVDMSVFGGGEFATVGWVKNSTMHDGHANVVIDGGTVGNENMYVEDEGRYIDDVHTDHSGHVFGGGQGVENDTLEVYRPYCNVNFAKVTVQGGKIYGSVFGGGAESHVLGNDSVYIHTGADIGSIGTTSWDGNVFGGGRGNGYFELDEPSEPGAEPEVIAYHVYKTGGRVEGNTYIQMDGGKICGSIFGGGRLGLTGVDVNGDYNNDNTKGKAVVKVSGGIIGIDDGEALLKSDESVGDIFGSGKGDAENYMDIWAGRVTNSEITVTGNPIIHGSVFGGGEMASIGYWETEGDNVGQFKAGTGLATVTIGKENSNDNPVIGTDYEFTVAHNLNPGQWTIYQTIDGVTKIEHTATGNVYGGCQGDVDPESPLWPSFGRSRESIVNIYGGTIKSCVFGGGEQGTVNGNTQVNVSGGTIGRPLLTASDGSKYNFGSLFGGGYGTTILDEHENDSMQNGVQLAGRVYGNTEVNFSGGHVYENVFGGGDLASVGWVKSNGDLVNGQCTVNVTGSAIVGPLDMTGLNAYVYGGGQGVGNDPDNPATLNISDEEFKSYCNVNSTIVNVDLNSSGRIYGSIFGGAADGHVLGDANVILDGGLIGTDGTTSWDGNIFGGGRNFHKMNYTAGRVGGNIHVVMNGGTLQGTLFGGGRLALTGIDENGVMQDGTAHGNTKVEVKGGTVGNASIIETWTTSTMGDVYGGGKGDLEGVKNHPAASALLLSLTKNTEVEISGTARVLGSVFGGGEVANVGRFSWGIVNGTIGDIELVSDGKATVTVKGGIIGAEMAQMRYEIAEGDGNYNLKYNDDRGHVFGGGEGHTGNPTDYATINPSSGTPGIHNNKSLLDLMATVNNTEVTISNSAWVKGSVYGGGMNGQVMNDAKVTVSGGQIGAGYYPATSNTLAKDSLYAVDKFFNPDIYFGTTHTNYTDVATADVLQGCYRWDYDPDDQKSFDPIAIKANPTANKPTTGETWFGSVYGGGSGYYPYITKVDGTDRDTAIWNPDAGRVFGNTEVVIEGGHILSNVYGGCQTSDVDSTAVVTMSGGSVGVPRTINSIKDFPYLSNLFGGAQGDFREQLNDLGDVDSTRVTISGDAVVYGSVFGGSQNGHVLDSTKVLVKGGVIGTTGLSSYDGCVYGGGQGTTCPYPGHTKDTLYAHAGRVGGNTRVVMTSGKALGNLYGGGMVALVGVGENGWFSDFVTGTTYPFTDHGKAKVEVKGGSVGNYFNNGRNLLTNNYPSGNVYGGGRGKLDEFEEDDIARIANAAVKISGEPTIYGSVYGGGEVANVGYWMGYEVGWYADGTATTNVSIEGSPTIGTALEFVGGDDYSHHPGQQTVFDTIRYVKYATAPNTENDTTYLRMLSHTRTGNVYGGGQGQVVIRTEGGRHKVFGLEQGHCGMAEVNINMNNGDTGGHILSSVFGGSEEGVVWGETKVTVEGGTIGTMNIKYDSLKYENNHWTSLTPNAGYYFGSVYGGSYGADFYNRFNISNPTQQVIDSVNLLAGCVYGNTYVDIKGGTIRGNVFGGGDMATVGNWKKKLETPTNPNSTLIDMELVEDPARPTFRGNATVNVSGGTIGPLDGTGLNAYVFGGGKGFYYDPDELRKAYANVDSTFVTVSGGKIYGSIFGGGNDNHVLGSAYIEVTGDADVGTDGLSTWDGNIFGGGRNFLNSNHSNGRVAGNIDIVMDGGSLQGSIFGGGRLALSGVNVNGEFPTTDWDVTKHGNVNIKVSGNATGSGDDITYSTVIGNGSDEGIHLLTESDESVGDIFGSGKGDTKNYMDTLAGRVTNTVITIEGSPRIHGAVFGGGEMASIGWWGADRRFVPNTGEATITIGREGQNDNPVIGTFLELDPDYLNDEFEVNGETYDHSDWTMIETVNGESRVFHTCTGNVFGGCQGDVDFEGWEDDDSDTWNNWPFMGRSRKATVTINGGTIMSHVFGGAEQGTLTEDTRVTINGGTIGSLVSTSNRENYYFGGVYGAGYGSDEDEENTTTITVDGRETTADMIAGRVYGNARVDVLGGTIQGDVYGGASFAYVGNYQDNGKGNVLVNIGKPEQAGHPELGTTIKGSVFGANNRSGTPYGNVKVNVISTAHTADNQYPAFAEGAEITPSCMDTLPDAVGNFALFQVYGGSNKADYLPYAGKADTVHVWYCKENTIYDVYGGCNAASIGSSTNRPVNTNVFIDGGRIFRVFGGGNGSGGVSADIHGMASTEIEGGIINQVFGGSNSLGQIEEVNLHIEDGGACALAIGDGFGGGNNAEIYGDVTTLIECGAGSYQNFYGGANLANIYGNVTVNVFGGTFDNLFAGSKGCVAGELPEYPQGKSADILDNPRTEDREEGNVTLNLFGGTIYDAAFGGSDANGRIEGKIHVNVFDAGGTCGLDLDTVYGAGRATTYEPFYAIAEGEKRFTPEVNVIHGTVKGCVLGGGQGVTATTTANPVVNIGYDSDIMGDATGGLIKTLFDTIQAHYTPSPWSVPTSSDYTAYVKKSVFGGGNQGDIDGSPSVNITKHNTVIDGSVFGGGHGRILAANETMQPADSIIGMVHGNDTVRIRGGHVKEYVFGGGELATVVGNTYVELTGGEVGVMNIHQVEDGEGHPVDSIIPELNIPYYHLLGGNVYGGGRGYLATENHDDYKNFGHVKGNTYVHVSDTAKIHDCVFGGGALGSVGSGNLSDKTSGVATVIISGGEIGPLDGSGLNAYVYGGGRGKDEDPQGAFANFANVDSTSVIVCDSARIYGSIFGGGSDGHVIGDVSILVEKGTNTKNKKPLIGTNGKTSWDGNIFGGGRNYMHTNYTAGRVGGNITVEMTDGQIYGNIYGGGRLGLTGVDVDGVMQDGDNHGHTKVMVKGGIVGNNTKTGNPNDPEETVIEVFSTHSMGNVYGGGMGNFEGVTGHPAASALLLGITKNTEVEISDDLGKGTHVYGIVFGGGELANVGKYTWTQDPETHQVSNISITEGLAKVNISGGIIGGDRTQMRALTDGSGSPWLYYNDDLGYVYGGGEGWSDNPANYANIQEGADASTTTSLLNLMSTVNNTEVTISGGWVKASVFGGGESGHVRGNTKVTISGGQIGAGYYETASGAVKDSLYDARQFFNPLDSLVTNQNCLSGTAHWVYEAPYTPFDPAYLSNGSYPKDGKSWFGNVFGGGSGWFPYVTGDDPSNYESHWNPVSGKVWGNTEVNITGGHILNNVYGANEFTDVGGKATVKMSGGTVGVPLTNEQITQRPLNGYIFGGGAGDPRSVLNNTTNVDTTDVQITGGIIYSSVYGGSEDGHVLGDTKVTISQDEGKATVIGSSGKSGYDGNVFGGGRNFFGENKEAGNVNGNTTIDMSDGIAMGCVYGGGRSGSVVKSTHVNISGGQVGTEQIGENQMTITNGNVYGGGLGVAGGKNNGNAHEFANVDSTYVNLSDNAYIVGSVFGGGDNGHVLKSTVINMTGGTVGQKNVLSEFITDSLECPAYGHIYTGSVLAGGRGTSTDNTGQYNDTTGIVFGNTNVSISGGTVRHAVYGGGGLSHVGTFTRDASTGEITFTNGGKCTVSVTGGLIGPKKEDLTDPTKEEFEAFFGPDTYSEATKHQYADTAFQYLGGNAGWVFGAGCGLVGSGMDRLTFNDSTFVTIGGTAQVTGSVYGGGENGHVKNNTRVVVSGGTIGGVPLHAGSYTVPAGAGEYAGVSVTLDAKDSETREDVYGAGRYVFRGNVYGGGKGTDLTDQGKYSMTAGRVYGNTKVVVSDGTIYNRVYGGGSLASVGKFTYHGGTVPSSLPLTDQLQRISYVEGTGVTNVIVSGGTIGSNGHNNGDVVGGGRGIAGNPGNPHAEFGNTDPADQVVRLAYVGSTNVNIHNGANIKSNVYGGSVNGHVYGDTYVTVDGGTIGSADNTGWHSNVFGGGGGSSRFKKSNGDLHFSLTSGRVYGNTNVTIESSGTNESPYKPTIYGSVFGGGAIASVGSYDLRTGHESIPVAPNTGTANVTVTSGTIGSTGIENGNVYGSGRGWPDAPLAYLDTLSYVVESNVIIGKDDDGTYAGDAQIKGSVYGSGENGHLYKQANVKVYSGTVDHSVFGAGEGAEHYMLNGKQRYNPMAGVVQGNTDVKVFGGLIKENVYGGGRLASVGILMQKINGDPVVTFIPDGNGATYGYTNVEVTGGTIGDASVVQYLDGDHPVRHGNVFGASMGMLLDTTVNRKWEYLANVKATHVRIGDDDESNSSIANVLSSVYGGSEVGIVRDSTFVQIQKGAVIGEALETLALHRGNVFAGGCGNDTITYAADTHHPQDVTMYVRKAGVVMRNARLEMTGGTVYGNLYGGCETTDVGTYNYPQHGSAQWISGGKATVIMRGGQLGWHRTQAQINNKPYYGYVYGSGKGDRRLDFNTWTNVNNANVEISGGTIYGSVLGGGEEGHVMNNTHVVVKGSETTIGTYGYTHYDGNVFGAGRGRDPEALTAGSIGGNTLVEIEDGTILGSIFGGGNNGTVGLYLVPGTHENYGKMQPGTGHGYTKVNISGGTIGHEVTPEITDPRTGGNVYGGGRGLAGAPGSPYQQVGKVKQTEVNITEAEGKQTFIMGSVFGSGEDGHVLQDTYVNIFDGQIGGTSYQTNPDAPITPCTDIYHGNVYGGGRGLDTYTEGGQEHYSITAGIVEGNTNVTVKGGRIVRNVYGGGNLSSVGNANETPDEETGEYSTGLATVNILGGTIGTTLAGSDVYMNFGNVFGSGHGGVGGEYANLAFVKNTHVTVDSTAMVIGSVFGGGEDGHVRMNTVVDIKGGMIGHDNELDLDGNVYGGGRDISDVLGTGSSSAGEVRGHTTVNIMQSDKQDANGNYYTPVIWDNVFGGGSTSMVDEYKVVNISAGTIKGNVYGGSRDIPHTRSNKAKRWVNMWGGTVEGNVYGCSHNSVDGDPANDQAFASFINLSGGTVKGSVFGASNYESTTVDEDYGGAVKGSVGILIGKNAIESMYTSENTYRHLESGVVPMDSLVILGNVFAGSEHTKDSVWGDYAVTGYSHIFIDGTGYNTTDTHVDDYMNITGGIYGSSFHCEAGKAGHSILVREYGTRDSETELTQASRSLTTIQRGDIVLLDHVNVNLSGAYDISGADTLDTRWDAPRTKYGVLKVNEGMYSANASGIVLGTVGTPVYMDTIKQLQSVYLKDNSGTTAYQQIGSFNESNWEAIGIKTNDGSFNKLYRIHDNGTQTELTSAGENVIIFNNTSKLWVRYRENDVKEYGELRGFFRMRADNYQPYDSVSFAYARPKLTVENGGIEQGGTAVNDGDGGFLSYNTSYNFHTKISDGFAYEGNDGGTEYTKAKQYPYTNVLAITRDDVYEYREWDIHTVVGRPWYVDGRTTEEGGIGLNGMIAGRGLYPDLPKKTISAASGNDADKKGIYAGAIALNGTTNVTFNQSEDAIYVVGAVNSKLELGIQTDGILNRNADKPLRLYRYPGGHVMSNGKTDLGPNAANDADKGPGANYKAMVDVKTLDANSTTGLTLNRVLVDGLYGNDGFDGSHMEIPESFDATNVDMPLVVTRANSILSMNDSTILKRGYNKTNANVWYTDADYKPALSEGGVYDKYHGGAIFVDTLAIVNVSGLDSIVGNKQNLNGQPIESNVYLHTFHTHLYVTDTLVAETRIGVTSPKRNKEADYTLNTLSPVALVSSRNHADAAWQHCNFRDDLGWFFVNGHTTASPRTTYYNGTMGKVNMLYFGWTWANVVRTQPEGYAESNGNITIGSKEGLAWLISKSAGMNGANATDFTGVTINQIGDSLDMKQYVWVPIGTEDKPFKGTYDGHGHLICNLDIAYIGIGDSIYERTDYGMFGRVESDAANRGVIDRTFVVSGYMEPVGSSDPINIGGLAGYLEGTTALVSNSEAAINIVCPNYTYARDVVAGGLVAKMNSGKIHSSMAMPTLSIGNLTRGPVGGLVGNASAGYIYNSFVNAEFGFNGDVENKVAGGLLGANQSAHVKNCYVNLHGDQIPVNANFDGIVNQVGNSSDIDYCYVVAGYDYDADNVGSNCQNFTSTVSADNLGYMYSDNILYKVSGENIENDTAMFVRLNEWVTNNGADTYARWARPGLSEINGDMPVLLLSDMSATDVESTDDFRSLATYNKGIVLQYGGTTRDGSDKHLSEMLKRDEYVFVYGDVDGHNDAETGLDGDEALATVTIKADKVSIYEHASIKYPGKLADLIDTYVGITFDNSFRKATATPGVNWGLIGPDGYDLPRDWHMFSSPLGNAPLGFNYFVGEENTNRDTYTSGDQGTYYNNIWVNQSTEFSWLTQPGSDECASGAGNRYWMKTFNVDDQKTDGYFPTRRGNLFEGHVNDLFIIGSDECPSSGQYRYPYGMDFYTWNEPQYHWINFKRNGPNHWHSDEPHAHLNYVPAEVEEGETPYPENQNEDKLIVGRGYMAAITTASFMQSHGYLNDDEQSIMLTNTSSSKLKGWNLVGNPYHGYLDFDLVATGDNLNVLSAENYLSGNANEGAFYVVYNADKYAHQDASTAFRYYPVHGSDGGDYAEQYLHPHQGFYVKAKAAGNLTFNENMLVSRETVAGNSHFRTDRPAYPLVNLYLSSDQGCADVTVIEFERPEWGGATKLKELRVGDGLFYAQHDNTHFAALFAKAGIDRVPLWFEAKEDDIFTMKWNTANGDFHSMYLIDNLTGVQYDMLRNNTYTFEGHKGDYPSRFLIVFSLTDVEEHVEESLSFVFFDGSQWMVTGEGQLEFIDVQGQVLMTKQVHGGQSRVGVPDVAPGVYLFRLTNSEGTRVQKVIVKR